MNTHPTRKPGLSLLPPKRRRRPRASAGKGKTAVYHVVSRTHGQQFLLEAVDKQRLRDLLGRVAEFCGIELLTYCILDNHFHLLVEVPGAVGDLDDTELIRRAALLYGGKERPGQPLTLTMVKAALAEGGEAREAMRELLMGRMGSLPMFVKILKQRFSISYNRLNERKGTLWEGPFRSVLVEASRKALALVGAYIDLNPVRAGLVEDPKDYRFCGYGEAVGSGTLHAYALLQRLERLGFGVERKTEERSNMTDHGSKAATPTDTQDHRNQSVENTVAGTTEMKERIERAAREYRLWLFETGTGTGASNKGQILSKRALWRVLAEGGELSRSQLLRCRVRYLTEGAVLGSRAFVEEWFIERRQDFGRRRSGARPLRGGDFGGLCALRDLREPVQTK